MKFFALKATILVLALTLLGSCSHFGHKSGGHDCGCKKAVTSDNKTDSECKDCKK